MTEYQFQYEWYDKRLNYWRPQWEPLRETLDIAKDDKAYLDAHFSHVIRNIRIVEVKEI